MPTTFDKNAGKTDTYVQMEHATSFLHLCQPNHLMGRTGWSQMESSFRLVASDPKAHVLGCSHGLRPRRTFRSPPSGKFQGVGDRLRDFTGLQTQDEPREIAQSSVARLENALEAMGDVPGTPVEVLKAELTTARAASKQPAVDVEIDQCRKFIARSQKRIRELDTRRVEECSENRGPGASREVLGTETPP